MMPPAPSMIGTSATTSCGFSPVSMTRSTWPARQHAIGVAIAAVARQPHLGFDPAIGRAVGVARISAGLVVITVASANAAQARVRKPASPIRTAALRRATAPGTRQPGALAVAEEPLAREWLRHHAVDRLGRDA